MSGPAPGGENSPIHPLGCAAWSVQLGRKPFCTPHTINNSSRFTQHINNRCPARNRARHTGRRSLLRIAPCVHSARLCAVPDSTLAACPDRSALGAVTACSRQPWSGWRRRARRLPGLGSRRRPGSRARTGPPAQRSRRAVPGLGPSCPAKAAPAAAERGPAGSRTHAVRSWMEEGAGSFPVV